MSLSLRFSKENIAVTSQEVQPQTLNKSLRSSGGLGVSEGGDTNEQSREFLTGICSLFMTTTQTLQHPNSNQGKGISAVEAATQAAAAYVWQASYTKGRKDGWFAGWAAAFRGDINIHGVPVKQRENGTTTVSRSYAEKQDEESGKATFELTEEWARLFARSTKAQKRQKLSQRETIPNEIEQFDLGGLMEKRRRRDAEKMYGGDAREIAEIEADLSANFEQIASETGASYWPVVSLRDGERPG